MKMIPLTRPQLRLGVAQIQHTFVLQSRKILNLCIDSKRGSRRHLSHDRLK
jgi:hypothetical protein